MQIVTNHFATSFSVISWVLGRKKKQHPKPLETLPPTPVPPPPPADFSKEIISPPTFHLSSPHTHLSLLQSKSILSRSPPPPVHVMPPNFHHSFIIWIFQQLSTTPRLFITAPIEMVMWHEEDGIYELLISIKRDTLRYPAEPPHTHTLSPHHHVF